MEFDDFIEICEDSDDDFAFEEEISEAIDRAQNETLPAISKERYFKEYAKFLQWKKSKNTCERTVLAYFSIMSKTKAPSSLYAYYSMLKAIIKIKENIDIGTYHPLVSFLKQQSVGYHPIKTRF